MELPSRFSWGNAGLKGKFNLSNPADLVSANECKYHGDGV
jgi:hypothetical protein